MCNKHSCRGPWARPRTNAGRARSPSESAFREVLPLAARISPGPPVCIYLYDEQYLRRNGSRCVRTLVCAKDTAAERRRTFDCGRDTRATDGQTRTRSSLSATLPFSSPLTISLSSVFLLSLHFTLLEAFLFFLSLFLFCLVCLFCFFFFFEFPFFIFILTTHSFCLAHNGSRWPTRLVRNNAKERPRRRLPLVPFGYFFSFSFFCGFARFNLLERMHYRDSSGAFSIGKLFHLHINGTRGSCVRLLFIWLVYWHSENIFL